MRKVFLLISAVTLAIVTSNSLFARSGDPPVSTEKTLHEFNGTADGADPLGGLIRDSAGNLYGTAEFGGTVGALGNPSGVVFKLTRMPGGTWKETVLYNFCPVAYCVDGANPNGGLVMDAAGNLYGTTINGGAVNQGVVFELIRIGGTWREIVLHHFCTSVTQYCGDGENPSSGLISDAGGNLYGTTLKGGTTEEGTVFEISTVSGGWLETVLHSFCQIESCQDGANPRGGVTFDIAGNLYGTAGGGPYNCFNPYGCGIVFEMSPVTSDVWQYAPLYDFCPVTGCLDGYMPVGGVTLDLLGNIYGTTSAGGTKGYGVVFGLTPITGTWQYGLLHTFCSIKNSTQNCADGANPATTMIFDSEQNLYGTTQIGGVGAGGMAFKLTPKVGGWQETVLHNFCTKQLCPDGSEPSALILDPQGNLYGTTNHGGLGITGGGPGVVFEITP